MDSTLEVTDYKAKPGSDHITKQKVAAAEGGEAKARGGSSIPGSDAGGHIVDFALAVSKPGLFYGFTRSQIYRAATRGDWNVVKDLYNEHRECATMELSAGKNTALHISVSLNQENFVKELLQLLNPKDMEVRNADDNTAFCIAAASGNVKIAQLLYQKHKGLVFISGKDQMLPFELAALAGHSVMVLHIYEMIKEHTPLTPQDQMARLFPLTISCSLYGLARSLLWVNPKLVTSQNKKGQTALQILAQQSPPELANEPFFEETEYKDLIGDLNEALVYQGMDLDSLTKALFEATKSGNIMFLKISLDHLPELIWKVDSNGQTLLHVAVFYRQAEVFELLREKDASNDLLTRSVVKEDNNILHMAAKLPPEKPSHKVSRAHIKMQREENWFKIVKKKVPHALRNMVNKDQLKPRDLFYQEHRKLSKDGEDAVKSILDNCMVVATLIAAIAFAAAITVPSKDTLKEEETPIFQQNTWYIIFIFSNAVALFSSSASVLFFLITITLSFNEDVFFSSIQKKLLLGFTALFVAMATMVVAFSAACFLIFNELSTWVAYAIASQGFILVFMFLLFHSDLWTQLFPSFSLRTYLFRRVVKLKNYILFRVMPLRRLF